LAALEGHAGDTERLHQTGPQDQELLENLRQVAERRRIDQNNVVLRSARRHFKTVKVVYTRQAVSEPAPRRELAGGCVWNGTRPASNSLFFHCAFHLRRAAVRHGLTAGESRIRTIGPAKGPSAQIFQVPFIPAERCRGPREKRGSYRRHRRRRVRGRRRDKGSRDTDLPEPARHGPTRRAESQRTREN